MNKNSQSQPGQSASSWTVVQKKAWHYTQMCHRVKQHFVFIPVVLQPFHMAPCQRLNFWFREAELLTYYFTHSYPHTYHKHTLFICL